MRALFLLLLAPALLTGCISYGVGTTAATNPAGERTMTVMAEATPAPDSTAACNDQIRDCAFQGVVIPMISSEVRIGLSDRSDWGVRLIGYTGAVFTYKRRLTAPDARLQAAVIGGGGLLNAFQTA